MSVLTIGQKVGAYTVQSVIKLNEYTETYRVANDADETFFLKLYVLKRTPERLMNLETHEVLAIERCSHLKHNNIVTYITSGKLTLECGECHYMVTCYFTGCLLADYVQRKAPLPADEALGIYRGVLEGLSYLHGQHLCHNDITPSNIMLNTAAGQVPEIIDMGHTAPPCSGKVPFEVADLEIFYCANETLMGIYDEQSDIFAATAVLYTMLTGRVPWQMDFTEGMSRTRRFSLLKAKRREEPLTLDDVKAEPYVLDILRDGMALSPDDRYETVAMVLKALDILPKLQDSAQYPDADQRTGKTQRPSSPSQRGQHFADDDESDPTSVTFEIEKTKGHGFDDIAGMEPLKQMLKQKVIFVLQNKELAERYRLTPPNGMLLYGPPGCGKTFFAEKFAEETGFNFLMVKTSDLANIYIHGSQKMIGRLFKQAEEKRPAVLCFDEFDAFVPNRSTSLNQGVASEVNEFLTQLNNCSKRGIFVIATSNRPDKIDPAVLRTGRIDKQVYVPMPDHEARREMFRLHLKDRPYDEEQMDLEALATKTEGYIASDIAYIVNDAAMVAAFSQQPITQDLVETSITNTRPSLTKESLNSYEKLRTQMENGERRNLDRQPIGFRMPD